MSLYELIGLFLMTTGCVLMLGALYILVRNEFTRNYMQRWATRDIDDYLMRGGTGNYELFLYSFRRFDSIKNSIIEKGTDHD
jgi:hypothetical protein